MRARLLSAMDKSDLEDGEVTSSDIDEPPPTAKAACDQPVQTKAGAAGDVIDITGDTASSSTVIEIPSDDNGAPSLTVRKPTTTSPGQAVQSDGGDADRKSLSRTSTKRRNQKRKQKEKEQAKVTLTSDDSDLFKYYMTAKLSAAQQSKTDAQIAQLEAAEMDEYELLCVRGASPPRHALRDHYEEAPPHHKRRRYADTDDDDDSDSGAYDRIGNPAERRERRRKRGSAGGGGSGRRQHQAGGSADDQYGGSNAQLASAGAAALLRQPRKMELCKFFLTGMCAKTAHCTYMHEDFPCKFFYLGIPHKISDCIFAHGPPLEPAWQGALLKHVERAPVAILGRFPKAYKTNAAKMLRATHERMMADLSGNCKLFGGTTVSIPDAAPAAAEENGNQQSQRQPANAANPFKANKQQQQTSRTYATVEPTDESGRWSPSGKLRPLAAAAAAGTHSASASAVAAGSATAGFAPIVEPPAATDSGRWSPSGRLRTAAAAPAVTTTAAASTLYAPTAQRVVLLPSPPMPVAKRASPPPSPLPPLRPLSTTPQPQPPPTTSTPGTGGRCVDLMADILNGEQLGRLRQIGVEYISQVENLTVAQLNEIGLSIAQIHQIQMCALQASAQAAAAAAAVASTQPTVHAATAVPVSSLVPGGVHAVGASLHHHRTNGDVDMRIPAMAVASTMSTTFHAPYANAVAVPAVPVTSDLAAPNRLQGE